MNMEMPITVIISLHKSDRADWFYQAASSVLDQTIPPSDMIVTIDGGIESGHEEAIQRVKLEFPSINYHEIRRSGVNSRGVMLGKAVKHSPTEFVAIMDADDISEKVRFEKQLNEFRKNPDIDVCGAWIREISPQDPNYTCYRKVPLNHTEIAKFARFRNPINNMTVMLKKSAAIEAGNYQGMLDFADYSLWVRMLCKGAVFTNVPEVLVVARAAEDMAKRRSGISYIRNEYKFYRQCFEVGFLSAPMAFFCFSVRAPFRLLSSRVLVNIFRRFLRD